MTLALGLLLAAVLVAAAGPVYLLGAVRPSVRPGLALAGWVSSLLLVPLCALTSATLLLLPWGSEVDGAIGMADSCLNLVRAEGAVEWLDLVRLGAALVLFGLLGWVGLVAVRMTRAQRRWRDEHVSLLRSVCRAGRDRVLWLEEDQPVAYSVGGRSGCVVATRGVAALSAPQRDAVLAHEYAHLHGRHHLLVLLAGIMGTALPFIPLCRKGAGAVPVLVELAADAVAAREHGHGPLRAALLAVREYGTPAGALAMSRDAVDARLCWLDQHRGGSHWLPVRWDYPVAVLFALAPTVAAAALVAFAVLVYCFGVGGY
ncbi:M56 family metallopeptidase [Crossiella cryophila]|uniref:Beta-lactamase regulating signal transducer with metallopeptidase domain n=1 Tax=Crossiella cryophila TaxID=43355 RepID=A0A7W7FYM1_9PSEU|nr:M56 family metallopeptidase [Crossiella cryophila]MBB4680184.1 beta-lactamase regulating signal transducer with metallopeptidase domain [Crossiella cryophila]